MTEQLTEILWMKGWTVASKVHQHKSTYCTPASFLPFTSFATTVLRSTYSCTPPTRLACTYMASMTAWGTSVLSHPPSSTCSHMSGALYPRPPSSFPPCSKSSPSWKRSAVAGSGMARRLRALLYAWLSARPSHPLTLLLHCHMLTAHPSSKSSLMSRTQCITIGVRSLKCSSRPVLASYRDEEDMHSVYSLVFGLG